MLDVLHFYFEEFFIQPSDEAAKRQSITRETIYETLYNESYRYAHNERSDSANRYIDLDEPLEPDLGEKIDPFNPVRKSYVPPTEMSDNLADPFSGVLDAPLR